MNHEDYEMEKMKCFWFCPAVAMFYVLDAASVTDLNFNTDDSGSNFLIPEHTLKQYNKSKGCISHLRILKSVVCITQIDTHMILLLLNFRWFDKDCVYEALKRR